MRSVRVPVRGVLTASVAAGLAAVIAAGTVGAAPVSRGRIAFAALLPVYPLPDNFQVSRQFSIRLDGRGRREINPSAHWTWSPDRRRIYFARQANAALEVWVESRAGTGRRRLAVLPDSGAIESLELSPSGDKLDVVAGALWVLDSTGSAPHIAFTPTDRSAITSVSWSRTGSRLFFVSGGGVWSAASDGSGAMRLFAASGEIRYALAPDASAVVVTTVEGTWLVSGSEDQPTKLTADEVDGVTWTPDGSAFAVEAVSTARCGLGSTKCAEWYLLLVSRSGSLLARFDDARTAAFSPDGRRLAFEAGGFAYAPEEATIRLARLDGTGQRNLSGKLKKDEEDCWRYPAWQGTKLVSFDETDCDPDSYQSGYRNVVVDGDTGRLVRSIAGTDLVASPDGKRVAYLRAHGNGVDLFVTALGGGKPVRLSPKHAYVDEAAWSPDGRLVAFTQGLDNGQQIYVVGSHGGRPRQLTRELQRSYEGDLEWSRDGRTLDYESSLEELGHETLWTIDAAGTAPRRLTSSSTSAEWPAWSPDGRRVAFTAYRGSGNTAEIDLVNANGTGEHRVVGKPGERDTRPAWSPDGKRLVFVRETNTTLVLGIVNADGTNVHLLKGATSTYGSPSWSPDGTQIVYSDSGTALMAIAPDGTGKHPLLRRECTAAACTQFGDVAFSPDGSRIAVTCSQCEPGVEAGLFVLRRDDATLTRVAAVRGIHPAWSADGRSIAFSGACGAPTPANGNLEYQLCIVEADGTGLRAVTAWPYGVAAPSWSAR